MLGSRLSEDRAIESKDSRRRLYAGNLWLLATEILGYDKLSLTFHKPMLEEWDREDRKRFKGKHADSLELWPRDHIKTWCERARVIRYYLIDPTIFGVQQLPGEVIVDSGPGYGQTLIDFRPQDPRHDTRIKNVGVALTVDAQKFTELVTPGLVWGAKRFAANG